MRNFLILTATLLVLFGVVCCTEKSTNQSAEATDSTAFRVAVLPVMECLPLYAAERSGVFDSLGLNVRLLTYEAAMDADTAFLRGHADAVATDLVKAVLWRSRGDSVRVVMAADLQLYLVTARQARLKTGASLKEKIVAFTRNSATDYTADGMLALAGLGSEQLNKPQINNLGLRTRMLMNYQYDGAILPEPWASLALADGHNLVFSTANLKRYNPLFAVVVNDSIAKLRRTELTSLVQAYDIMAERISRSDSADVSKWLSCIPWQEVWPDSIDFQPMVSSSRRPTDAVVDSVKSWLRGRRLLENDFKNSELTSF